MAEYVAKNTSFPQQQNTSHELTAAEEAWEHFREYAKERPEVVVLWAFGIGFVLGWKLKPW